MTLFVDGFRYSLSVASSRTGHSLANRGTGTGTGTSGGQDESFLSDIDPFDASLMVII